ncbi:MAG: hypothetical protein IJT30_09295 [Muribaculaceae bacterium]|nr:hypothetical protein [Muribaculaceae bacterium]
MLLTDYYRFERVATKSKTRLDCTASTESYQPFEEKRQDKQGKPTASRDGYNVGDLLAYFVDVPDQFSGDVHRKADKSLTMKGKNLTSIYVLDPTSNLAFGDVKGEADAILFVFEGFEVVNKVVQQGGVLELFIARGKSKDRVPLYNLLSEGEFDEEMNLLRERATRHHPATGQPAASELDTEPASQEPSE